MAKNHRGTGIRTLPAHGRGTCPLCKSTGIKVVYEKEVERYMKIAAPFRSVASSIALS